MADMANSELVERAFKLKWECELLKDDFDGATATCSQPDEPTWSRTPTAPQPP